MDSKLSCSMLLQLPSQWHGLRGLRYGKGTPLLKLDSRSGWQYGTEPGTRDTSTSHPLPLVNAHRTRAAPRAERLDLSHDDSVVYMDKTEVGQGRACYSPLLVESSLTSVPSAPSAYPSSSCCSTRPHYPLPKCREERIPQRLWCAPLRTAHASRRRPSSER